MAMRLASFAEAAFKRHRDLLLWIGSAYAGRKLIGGGPRRSTRVAYLSLAYSALACS